MKTIIAGSREGITFDHVFDAMTKSGLRPTEVVSGTARGADTKGEEWAYHQDIPVIQFKPDWDKLGKAAGFIRNKQMAEYADSLVAIWNGTSKGTQHMIKTMEALGKPVFVYKTDNL